MENVDLNYKMNLSKRDDRTDVIVAWLKEHKRFINVETDSVKIVINVRGRNVLGEITSFVGGGRKM